MSLLGRLLAFLGLGLAPQYAAPGSAAGIDPAATQTPLPPGPPPAAGASSRPQPTTDALGDVVKDATTVVVVAKTAVAVGTAAAGAVSSAAGAISAASAAASAAAPTAIAAAAAPFAGAAVIAGLGVLGYMAFDSLLATYNPESMRRINLNNTMARLSVQAPVTIEAHPIVTNADDPAQVQLAGAWMTRAAAQIVAFANAENLEGLARSQYFNSIFNPAAAQNSLTTSGGAGTDLRREF